MGDVAPSVTPSTGLKVITSGVSGVQIGLSGVIGLGLVGLDGVLLGQHTFRYLPFPYSQVSPAVFQSLRLINGPQRRISIQLQPGLGLLLGRLAG